MKNFPECEEYLIDKKIVCSENKCKMIFINAEQNQVRKIRVDGCVITDNKTLRCDYAIIPNTEVEIYVELKGTKIMHAFAQIESTIKIMSSNPKIIKKYCFIVCTRVGISKTQKQEQKSIFKNLYNAETDIKAKENTFTL